MNCLVIQSHNAGKHPNLLRQMFRLRAEVFTEKGWDVEVDDEGLETDDYDKKNPVYLLVTDERRKTVLATGRLMPTTGPTLTEKVFADTVPDGANLKSPSIWECTRTCWQPHLGLGKSYELLEVARVFIEGLGEVAESAVVESLIGHLDSSILGMYRRFGLKIDVLGTTQRFGAPVHLGLIDVRPEAINASLQCLDELLKIPA